MCDDGRMVKTDGNSRNGRLSLAPELMRNRLAPYLADSDKDFRFADKTLDPIHMLYVGEMDGLSARPTRSLKPTFLSLGCTTST